MLALIACYLVIFWKALGAHVSPAYSASMSTLKAVVQNGRAVLEGVNYPDGTELEFTIVVNDEMSAEEQKRLDASIERGIAQMESGDTIAAEEVIALLRTRGR